MVLITGAGGQVGTAILKALSAHDISTRAWIHRAAQREAVLAAGATEVFVGDMAVREDAEQAMEGIDTILFICNAANPREDAIGTSLIALAKERGNITFVYHSVLHSLLSELPHHEKKRMVEQALVNSELPYVILQPAVFMQMFAPGLQSVKHGGPFVQKFFTSNQTKMTFLALEDYGEAVARIIEAGSFVYGTYELCADGVYSLTDLEAILSDIAGRKVSSAFLRDEDFLAASNMDPNSYVGQTLLTMFRHYNKSSFCGSAFTLTQILGREPKTLKNYIQNILQP